MELRQGSVSANGLRFATLEAGSTGPLALCLHGFPDTAFTWRHLLPALATAGFRAVAPYLRGYAPTGVPEDGRYDGTALADDVTALHEAYAGDGNAVLIGHDWGAITAYTAGAAAPERWRRLVTMAVPPPGTAMAGFFDYEQLRRSFYVFLFQTPLAELVVSADDFAFVERLWRDWSPSYDAAADLPRVKAALREPANLQAAIGYYRALLDGSARSDGVAPQPTLYLHGRQDGAYGVDRVLDAEQHLGPGSRLDLLDAGHFLHLERPAEVNRMVLDWVCAGRA